MGRAALTSQTCTLARAVALAGDEWTLLLLRELFLGTRRFDQFLARTGMSSHLLAKRLKKLEAGGILERRLYCARPARHEYRLTTMGRELWPVIVAFKQWGDRWLSGGETPVKLVHRDCGQVTEPRMACSHCNAPMTARDAVPRLSARFADEREHAGKPGD